MVDISSGDKKINITVSTSGNKASVNATPDAAMYYSNKSREWAISDKIVDNGDYSSKYYANISKQNADKSTVNLENLTTNYNQYKNELENTKNISVEEIETAKTNAITDITNQETLSVDNVNTAGVTQVNLAKEQATIATEQAGIATAKTSEVVESGNNAITAITEQETTSKNNIIAKGAEQIELIQNEGATQVANVQSTGQTEYNKIITTGIDNKVSKSGDTMTGVLNFNESPVVHDFTSNTNCYVQRTNRILSNADPVDSDIFVPGISIADATSYEIAKTEIARYRDGTIQHNFLARNINGVGTGWAAIGVGFKPDGIPITYAPTPLTGDDSNQIATTAWVKALPRLIETWESEWFTIAMSQSHSWNLASTGMNATNSIHIKPEIIAKVITADAGYAVGDIVYGQWMNYIGSTGSQEQGSSLCFTNSTLTFSTGNAYMWGNVKKGGGQDGIATENAQLKIILRRFSN